jgi:phage repressor protein C with HTH and peptisase S24 domain
MLLIEDQVKIWRVARAVDGRLIFTSDNPALYGEDGLSPDRLEQLQAVGRVRLD